MRYRSSLNRISVTLTLISALSIAAVMPANAQSSSNSSPATQTVTVSEDFLKAVDKAFVELKALRELKAISDEERTQFQDTIQQLRLAINIQEQQLRHEHQAAAEGVAAVAKLQEVLGKAKKLLDDFEAELAKVRKQRDKAQSRLWKVGAGAFVAGLLTAIALLK